MIYDENKDLCQNILDEPGNPQFKSFLINLGMKPKPIEDTPLMTGKKYFGYTYKWIFENDPGYCRWVLRLEDPDYCFRRFQIWLMTVVEKRR